MAGLSQRFRSHGFSSPKHLLPLAGQSVFYWALRSMQEYFDKELIIFATLKSNYDSDFISQNCKLLGINNFQIYVLDEVTSGQAETIRMVTAFLPGNAKNDGLYIFNIDTIRPSLRFPRLADNSGWLELFMGLGDHWSFARLSNTMQGQVVEVAEKRRISDWCSTGAYAFSSITFFESSFDLIYNEKWAGVEKYVAPILQSIIERDFAVVSTCIDDSKMIPCGTPQEYLRCKELNLEKIFPELKH